MAHPIKHFITITKHRHKVIAHCAKAGILGRGLLHDLSKYTPTEFINGAKYFSGTRSPNELERYDRGHSLAWMHHKGRNRHHYEYWTDYSTVTKKIESIKMPLVFVIEMFCDRVAASKTYKKKDYSPSHPLEYLHMGKAGPLMHEDTYRLLEELLTMLKEKGEKETFTYIRKVLLKKKDY